MMTEEDALKGENIEHIDATSQVDTNIVSETAEAGETSAPACPAADTQQAEEEPEDAAADASAAMANLIDDEGAQSVEDPHIDPNAAPLNLDDDPEDDLHEQAGAANASASVTDTPQAAAQANDPQATVEIDKIELAALMNSGDAGQTMPFAPVQERPAQPKPASDRISGTAKRTGTLAWGSRSDVGLVREHNEDSFVVHFPLFAVADGMGGHEAGEVASTIAVSRLAETAPSTADDSALAAAIEAANQAVIEGPSKGTGKPGMGTTCTAVVIDGSTMAVAHVGDSRCYLLHKGKLMRVTHDHSYVEELVAAGQITPEEARIHPNRSVITRALGNDPKMHADHFSIDVSKGDRVLL